MFNYIIIGVQAQWGMLKIYNEISVGHARFSFTIAYRSPPPPNFMYQAGNKYCGKFSICYTSLIHQIEGVSQLSAPLP